MSRTCSKEVMTDIYDAEIVAQQRLIDDAKPRAAKAVEEGKLSKEAFEALGKADDFNKAAVALLEGEDFKKSLHFLIRSVANYYLMLGDKGVLRNVPKA